MKEIIPLCPLVTHGLTPHLAQSLMNGQTPIPYEPLLQGNNGPAALQVTHKPGACVQ